MTHGPLVVLHDHLDGGVRPATVLELCRAAGVATPVDDAGALADWMTIDPGLPIEEAFSRFDLVTAALQTPEALRRVAREAVEDLAADGVIHAELRFAPLLHIAGGLSPREVLAAVSAGLDDGHATSGLDAKLIVCLMRDQPPSGSEAAVDAAVAFGGRVVGVDVAGIEPGFPAELHQDALARAKTAGLGVTIHAGEMDGPHQVASALACAPDRIGHGWRIIDDCTVTDGRIAGLGPTAAALRDAGLPLEVCLTSNACLGLPIADHPVRLLADAGFRVGLNPDDRSITTTSARREFALARDVLGLTDIELAAMSERAAVAAFLPDGERAALVARVRAGWDVTVPRLVHLAERDRWAAAQASGVYLPAEFVRDGFIHLSSLHQVLTPANRFYRGRDDLVAVVIDALMIDNALVWEPGTGTDEYFPHLYGALGTDAVLAEIPFPPEPDGSFLLPPALVRAIRR
ncbi:MAG: adenosine deaminase [Actinomycetota bacterium]